MREVGFFARFRARLHRDERGFGLLETVIAVTVIFASLTALAYTATIGFNYGAFARERQAAAGVANRIMEEARGLAYAKITQGLSSTDLSGDPNILDCSGVYRFESCTAGANGVGDPIVWSTGLSNVTPLVPHHGTIAATPSSAGYSVSYEWWAYVTNPDTTTNPYRVTVVVTWAATRFSSLAHEVRTQSLFFSPSGCVSSSTHPFAAPCQPFFFGQALVPQGRVDVGGSVQGLSTFESGSFLLTGAESDGQQEQVSEIQGSYTQTGTSLKEGGTTTTGGGSSSSTTAADGDPAGATLTYASQSLASGVGSTLSSSAGSTSVDFTNAAGDTARADSAISAGTVAATAIVDGVTQTNVTAVCPPPTDTAEADGQPCGGSRIQQAGTLSAVLHPHGITPDLGDTTLAQVAASAGNPNKTFVNRVLVSGQDGYLQQTATRSVGTFNLAGMPASFAGPAGWTGYLLTMTNYADSAVAAAGTSSPAATTTISAGSISYWNGTGYSSLTPGTTSVAIPVAPVSISRTIGGETVVIDITASLSTGGATTSCDVSCAGTLTRTSATSTVASPVTGTVDYTITVDGDTVVSLQVSVDFGTITAKAVYAAAPTAG